LLKLAVIRPGRAVVLGHAERHTSNAFFITAEFKRKQNAPEVLKVLPGDCFLISTTRNRPVRGGVSIQGDHSRGSMLFSRPEKEPLGGCNVTPFAQEKVDGSTLLIDGAIEVDPLPFDFDVGFIHTPGVADQHLPGCGPERRDLKRFLWDFTYLCWANPTLFR
jgi:hypothetical protein